MSSPPSRSAALREAIRYRGAVSDTDLADNHYRIVDGNRLMWSGRSTTWEADPRRYVDKLRADIAEVYPQLGKSGSSTSGSGVLGNALHRMPQIGELSPGFWMACGFGGHGLNTTAMAGNILARAIVDGEDTWRLFSPYELVWAGGKLGRAVKQVYYWWFRAQERFEARQAREREAEIERTNGREPAWTEHREARHRAADRARSRHAGRAGAGFAAGRSGADRKAGDGGCFKRTQTAARRRPGAPSTVPVVEDFDAAWPARHAAAQPATSRRTPAPSRANRDHLPRAALRPRQDD